MMTNTQIDLLLRAARGDADPAEAVRALLNCVWRRYGLYRAVFCPALGELPILWVQATPGYQTVEVRYNTSQDAHRGGGLGIYCYPHQIEHIMRTEADDHGFILF